MHFHNISFKIDNVTLNMLTGIYSTFIKPRYVIQKRLSLEKGVEYVGKFIFKIA